MSNPTAPQPIPLQATLSALPPIYPGDLRAQTRALLAANASSIPLLVALDDDPTGTQTCHDIRVLTVWDVESLAAEFAATRAGSGFFILTNSRALHTADARALTAEICGNLRAAGERAGRAFEVVLRGDSTLRGHFPDEPEVVDAELGGSAAWVLAPFFLQGGRYTIDDVHYVAEGETLVPAGETPFARDATFGYRSSDLRDWVVEKSGGKIARERVVSLGLKDIREGGPERIAELLEGFEKGAVIVVNAAAEEDMDVVVLGLLKGKPVEPFSFCSPPQSWKYGEILLLTVPISFIEGQTFPLPYRSRVRICAPGHLSHPSHLGAATATFPGSWWLDYRRFLRAENDGAAGGPDIEER